MDHGDANITGQFAIHGGPAQEAQLIVWYFCSAMLIGRLSNPKGFQGLDFGISTRSPSGHINTPRMSHAITPLWCPNAEAE